MLKGMDWLLEEETFTASQNHTDLLLVMGQISGGRVSPTGPGSPGEQQENDRLAAIARDRDGEIRSPICDWMQTNIGSLHIRHRFCL